MKLAKKKKKRWTLGRKDIDSCLGYTQGRTKSIQTRYGVRTHRKKKRKSKREGTLTKSVERRSSGLKGNWVEKGTKGNGSRGLGRTLCAGGSVIKRVLRQEAGLSRFQRTPIFLPKWISVACANPFGGEPFPPTRTRPTSGRLCPFFFSYFASAVSVSFLFRSLFTLLSSSE